MRRVGIAVLLLSAPLAASAQAARVVDVRVGAHAGYTRVVLELDQPAAYRISQEELPRNGGSVTELVVHLDATGAFALARRRGLVESVRVKPEGQGGVARIRLGTSRPTVADMVLSDPPRIVIDVRRGVRAAAAPPAPTPAPAKPVAEAPAPEVAPEAEEAAAEAEAAEEPAAAEAPEPAAEAAPPARPPAPPPLPRRPAPTPVEEPGGLLSYLLSNARIVATVAVLVVLFVVWRVLLRRRARARVGEAELFPPLPAVDAAGAEEVVAEAEPAAAESSVSEADVELPVPVETAAAMPSESSVPAGDEAEREVREVERRLRHLETRLEELADARERAERQLAAHTEELRVQRAAIARAQRVLRNLTRPDEASEPVARDPSRDPSR